MAAVVAAVFQDDVNIIVQAVFVLWVTASLVAHIVLQDTPRRIAITGFLDNHGNGSAYVRLVAPIANLPRDWRCYDWAMRLAVFYPIVSILLVWAITGRVGTIGTVRFLPAHDSWLVTLATLCALGLVFRVEPFISGPQRARNH